VATSADSALVSAVIPCYRCDDTIARAVQSVFDQTRRPFELVLVDDGNDVGTSRWLRELEARHSGWIRLVRLQHNAGVSAARNAGWNAARGKYVAFLDADDTWLPQKIERQCAFMEAHAEIVLTGHLDHGARRAPLPGDGREYRMLSRFWVTLGNPFAPSSFMARRDLGLRFSEERRHMEDHRFVQQLVFAGRAVARLETRLGVMHKPVFGHSGLSAQLWAMERAELRNYADLRRERHLGFATYWLLLGYSLLKFARRVMLSRLRQLFA
jgi:glycosyltransferase involved in cell wall biosynthesis